MSKEAFALAAFVETHDPIEGAAAAVESTLQSAIDADDGTTRSRAEPTPDGVESWSLR